MKQKLATLLKIVVALAILAFILTRIDLQVVGQIIAQANLALLLAALLLYFFAIVVGAFKWQILVKAQAIQTSLGALLSYSLMALFFGNVMPTNIGGDVIRAYELAKATQGRAEESAVSVLVDRLMGMLAFFVMAMVTALLATLLLAQAQQLEQIETATVAAASALMVFCALLFSRRLARRAVILFEWGPLQRLKPIAAKSFRALQVYRSHYRALAANFACSLVILVITAFVWFLVGRAVGITEVDFFFYLLVNPLIGFVLLIPFSLNGLGPKEAVVMFLFGLMGVAPERALAMSLLFHLIVVLTSLPGGVIWLAGKKPRAEKPLPNHGEG